MCILLLVRGLRAEAWGILLKEAGLLAPALSLGALVTSGPSAEAKSSGLEPEPCPNRNREFAPLEANSMSNCRAASWMAQWPGKEGKKWALHRPLGGKDAEHCS